VTVSEKDKGEKISLAEGASNSDDLMIYRKRYVVMTILGRRYTSFVRIYPSELEMRGIEHGLLRSCRIQTSETFNLSRAFNFQLNRVRDRWNVAIKRTSGFVIIDTIQAFFLNLAVGIQGLFRVFFGTRIRFSDLLEGAEFQCRTLEELKETETMVFASIAAIIRAARYAEENNSEITYRGDEFMQHVKGLTFAGGMIGTMNQEEDDQNSDDNDADDEYDIDDDLDEFADDFDDDLLDMI